MLLFDGRDKRQDGLQRIGHPRASLLSTTIARERVEIGGSILASNDADRSKTCTHSPHLVFGARLRFSSNSTTSQFRFDIQVSLLTLDSSLRSYVVSESAESIRSNGTKTRKEREIAYTCTATRSFA